MYAHVFMFVCIYNSQKQCLMSFPQEHFITLQAHVRCQFKHTTSTCTPQVIMQRVENKQRTNGREKCLLVISSMR